MTLCPIAVSVGCKKCPAFSFCPVKTVIGDYRPPEIIKMTPRPPDSEATRPADQEMNSPE